MNMLRLTAEQVAAHNARIKAGAVRVVKFDGNQTEAEVIKAAKGKAAQKLRKPSVRRPTPSLEDSLDAQLRAMSINLERQYRWMPNRKYRADFAHPKTRLLVELDGAAHRIKGRFDDDIRKSQDALLCGWRLLRISTRQVRTGEAADVVRRAIDMVVPF